MYATQSIPNMGVKWKKKIVSMHLPCSSLPGGTTAWEKENRGEKKKLRRYESKKLALSHTCYSFSLLLAQVIIIMLRKWKQHQFVQKKTISTHTYRMLELCTYLIGTQEEYKKTHTVSQQHFFNSPFFLGVLGMGTSVDCACFIFPSFLISLIPFPLFFVGMNVRQRWCWWNGKNSWSCWNFQQ